jgi:hypothetical protein
MPPSVALQEVARRVGLKAARVTFTALTTHTSLERVRDTHRLPPPSNTL